VDILYTSPTAVRVIRTEDPEGKVVGKYDISTLKVLGVVGERTDVHTYEYLRKIMPKNCLYNDTYWQTETGWFISANFIKPQRFSIKAGSCTKAFPGYQICIYGDDKKQIHERKQLGHVVIKLPMPPGFMLSIWGNDKAFVKKYLTEFEGHYQTGDAGYLDEDGYLHILTRTDDII
jgi:propionyl-CoA synthetase